MVSGSLRKGRPRSWPSSVASKGVLFPQAHHLLSGMCPGGCQSLKSRPPESLPSRPEPGHLSSCLPSPRWLCNAAIDTRTRRWAVEGLAYLTLDADVKDDFVQDIPALQAMFELAKASGATASGLSDVGWMQAPGILGGAWAVVSSS